MSGNPPTTAVALYKVSGAGNDFLALAEPAEEPTAAQVRAWCRRGISLGADGLFTLRRTGAGRVAMSYRNADGGPADLCLNGTRCAARLAFDLGWATDRVTVETGAGPLPARRLDASRVAIAAPPPSAPPEPLRLEADGALHEAWHVTVGVPHLVLLRPDLPDAPVDRLGRALRRHLALAPEGANVDFIRLPTPHHLEIRTYERGVEAETLACGTGILAAAAAALQANLATLPLTVQTKGGFPLGIEGTDPSNWELTGDARLIARVHLLPEAADSPTPPDWR